MRETDEGDEGGVRPDPPPPKAQLAAVVDRLRGRGLVDAAGGFTDAGRATRERIEALTDELAATAYDVLSTDELDELVAGLEPIAAAVEDDGSVEAVATAVAALGRLEVLHGDAGELTQGDEGSHAQQRADLGRVADARERDVLDPDARPALHDTRVADCSCAARTCRDPRPDSVSASNRQTTAGG
jgi:hypothetical protein